jgi:ubiquinone biosynthesis protein
MVDAARLSWRLLVIIRIVTYYVIRVTLLLAFERRCSRSRDTIIGECLCRCCEALGPTFIKLGQVLSARPDLIPSEWARELGRLQTQVKPLRRQSILRALRKAYSQPIAAIFAAFDVEPIGSGSIAQVHRARLKDGLDVAVKIRRPGIEGKVDADLKLLVFFARLAARMRAARFLPVVQVAKEVCNLVGQQLDFSREAESNRRFHREFRHVELVRFPVLVEALCTRTVLVMEFMPDLTKAKAAGLATDLKQEAALRGLRVLYQMIFVNGFVHADLHPGNMFFGEWGDVTIIDMGLVAQLNDRTRQHFVDFFFAFVNRRGGVCADILCESATFIAQDCDLRSFKRQIVRLIDSYAGLRSREFEITRFVAALMETQRRFRICGSTDFVAAIIALVVFDGICKQLYPECDFQAEARPFLIAAKYRNPGIALQMEFLST